jgi:hypothetical protein
VPGSGEDVISVIPPPGVEEVTAISWDSPNRQPSSAGQCVNASRVPSGEKFGSRASTVPLMGVMLTSPVVSGLMVKIAWGPPPTSLSKAIRELSGDHAGLKSLALPGSAASVTFA